MTDRFVDPSHENVSLDELAAHAAKGDQRALDTLLARIRPEVLRRCAALLLYRADAEDACQEALLQVARNITGFQGRSKFTTWAYVIIANCTRQTYRSLLRRAGERTYDELPIQPLDPRTTSVIAGARISLLDALERLEQVRPELVAPFVLRDLCDLEYSEIVGKLGIPLSTVKFRIHEARKFVRPYLAESPA